MIIHQYLFMRKGLFYLSFHPFPLQLMTGFYHILTIPQPVTDQRVLIDDIAKTIHLLEAQ